MAVTTLVSALTQELSIDVHEQIDDERFVDNTYVASDNLGKAVTITPTLVIVNGGETIEVTRLSTSIQQQIVELFNSR